MLPIVLKYLEKAFLYHVYLLFSDGIIKGLHSVADGLENGLCAVDGLVKELSLDCDGLEKGLSLHGLAKR